MLNSNQFDDQAQFRRDQLMREAERERLAAAARAARQVRVMFWVYLAELLAAAGAVVILRP